MTQGINPTLLDSTPLRDSRAPLIENDNTLRNNFLGTSHPASPVDGQFSARSDESKLYIRWAGAWTQIAGDGAILFAHLAPAAWDSDPTLAANSNTVLPTQGAVKAYVDNLITGLKWKPSVRAATTANGTLASAFANGQTIDGVTLATGDRILLKNQSSGAENGRRRTIPMTDQNTAPDWMLAAQNEVAAQLGRLTIDNATLRAQGRAQAVELQQLGAAHSKTLAELSKAQEELSGAKAELSLLKGVKPDAPAAPAGLPSHDAQG